MRHPVVWFEVIGKQGEAMKKFYGELFNWKIKSDNPMHYGMVDHGGKGIGGGIAETDGKAPSGVRFYVESADLEASLARAEKLGGKRLLPPTALPDGGHIAMFSDPEGHVVGLVEPMGN